VPTADFYEKLGENVDVIILALNSDFDDKYWLINWIHAWFY
jgi:hypothetical protein